MANWQDVRITIGNVEFDDVRYDTERDTLHLAVSGERTEAWTEESLEGHTLRYAADGALIGMTIDDLRLQVARNGGVTITPPRRFLERSDLEGVL